MLVLASTSPRRQQLLGWLGVAYEVDGADVDERSRPGEAASDMVARLARAKAAVVAARRREAWVLGADTIVELDGVMFGKPSGRIEAVAMLSRLAGRAHRVATGFALLGPARVVAAADVVLTTVVFRQLDARAIEAYVASGEADDKAGGYAIQGLGAALIDRIDGSFTNVIGLPLVEVTRALEKAGFVGR